jgi:hypothetical protein
MSRLGHLQSFNMSRLGHLQSFNMSRLDICSRLGHLQLSLSRPSDWKTTTSWCISMLIQNMASVVIFELHRTCSCSLSGCRGHGFLLVSEAVKTFSHRYPLSLRCEHQRRHSGGGAIDASKSHQKF